MNTLVGFWGIVAAWRRCIIITLSFPFPTPLRPQECKGGAPLDEATFKAVSAAHPHFLQGQWLKASEVVIRKISRNLRRQSRRARRDPEAFETPHESTEGPGEVLERIRARHRGSGRKTQA